MTTLAERLPWHDDLWARYGAHFVNGTLPHGLLLAGQEGTGKAAFAARGAALWLCTKPVAEAPCGECRSCRLLAAGNHPDWLRIEPEGNRPITVQAIRDLRDRLTINPHLSRRRVVEIAPAERMNSAAANALLKTLEEPEAGTLFMLISHRPVRLPATIRSRTALLRFAPTWRSDVADWLGRTVGDRVADPRAALHAAGGAPMAIDAAGEGERLGLRERLLEVLESVLEGGTPSVGLAQCAEDTPLQVVDQLQRLVDDLVRIRFGGGEQSLFYPELVPRMERLARSFPAKRLFAVEHALREARRLSEQPVNHLLMIEAALQASHSA